MSEGTHKIVLKGYGDLDKGKYYIEHELAQLFGIEQKVAKKLLEVSGEEPRDVKKGVDSKTAERYLKALKATGADGEIIDTRYDFSGLSIE
jgi:large subunit ribosomal protein L7/L12